jgi:hypothetical protein
MKSPPEQYRDDIARDKTEEFIQKYGRVMDLGGNGKKPKKAKTKVAEKPKSRLKKTVKKKARVK